MLIPFGRPQDIMVDEAITFTPHHHIITPREETHFIGLRLCAVFGVWCFFLCVWFCPKPYKTRINRSETRFLSKHMRTSDLLSLCVCVSVLLSSSPALSSPADANHSGLVRAPHVTNTHKCAHAVRRPRDPFSVIRSSILGLARACD